jgi:O-antigen/teichoic acid export membrane protein
MRSIKSNTFLGLITDLGISGIKIIKIIFLIPFIIKFSSAESYGLYLTVLSFVGLIGFFDFGTNLFFIKELSLKVSSKYNKEVIISTGSNLIVLNTLFILFISFSIFLISSYFKYEDSLAIQLFFFLIISKVIANLYSIPISILHSNQKMSFVNSVKSLLTLFEVLFVIVILIEYDMGVISLVYGELAYHTVLFFILYIYVRKPLKLYSLNLDKSFLNHSLKYSFSYYLIKLSRLGLSNLDNILIYYFIDSTAVVIYTSTIKLPLLFSREIGGKIGNNLFPSLSSVNFFKEIESIKIIFLKIFNISTRVSFFFFLIIILINEKFINLWVGSDFYGGDLLNFIFAVLVFFEMIYFSTEPFSLVYGSIEKIAKASIIELTANIIISIFSVYYIGLSGIAIGSLISKLFTSFFYIFYHNFEIMRLDIGLFFKNFFFYLKKSIYFISIMYIIGILLIDINELLYILIIPVLALISNISIFNFQQLFDINTSLKIKLKSVFDNSIIS